VMAHLRAVFRSPHHFSTMVREAPPRHSPPPLRPGLAYSSARLTFTSVFDLSNAYPFPRDYLFSRPGTIRFSLCPAPSPLQSVDDPEISIFRPVLSMAWIKVTCPYFSRKFIRLAAQIFLVLLLPVAVPLPPPDQWK